MSIAEKSTLPNLSNIFSRLHMIIPVGVMGILLVMVLPMPTMVLDLLISLNITISIVVLLVAGGVRTEKSSDCCLKGAAIDLCYLLRLLIHALLIIRFDSLA